MSESSEEESLSDMGTEIDEDLESSELENEVPEQEEEDAKTEECDSSEISMHKTAFGILKGALKDVVPSRRFCVAAQWQDLPDVVVEGIGQIAFPLLPAQAKNLASNGSQVPFGKVLTSVEKCISHQFDVTDVKLGSSFHSALQKQARKIVEEIDADPNNTHVRLRKLILCQGKGLFQINTDKVGDSEIFGFMIAVTSPTRRWCPCSQARDR